MKRAVSVYIGIQAALGVLVLGFGVQALLAGPIVAPVMLLAIPVAWFAGVETERRMYGYLTR